MSRLTDRLAAVGAWLRHRRQTPPELPWRPSNPPVGAGSAADDDTAEPELPQPTVTGEVPAPADADRPPSEVDAPGEAETDEVEASEVQAEVPDAGIAAGEADATAPAEVTEPDEPEEEPSIAERPVAEPSAAEPTATDSLPGRRAPAEADATGESDAAALPGGPPVSAGALGRRRLLDAMRPRLSAGQLLAALLCGLLAFAAVVQARSNAQAGLTSLRVSDLLRVFGEMGERRARVEAETRELEQRLARVAAGGDEQAAEEDLRRQIEQLAILAGLAPVTGPGVEVTVMDPTGQVMADQLLDAVQELRGAGAESISVGDVRVVASTAFVDGPTGITVDGKPVAAPYRIKAVGDPRSLATALDIPGGVTEVLRQQYGATATVQQRDNLRIDAVREAPERRYAQTVTPSPTP